MEEKRSKKWLKENYKLSWGNRAMSAITVIVCITAAIFFATTADAAYAGNYDDIGTYNDTVGGKSINGVRISKNSEILNYALDMWEKDSNGEWKYTGSNINGNVSEIDSSNSSPVFIKGKSEPRFGIDMNNIKNKLPRNGSVVVRKYRKGRLIYERTELTYQTEKENEVEDSISLLKQAAKSTARLELPSTDYSFDSVSYIYDIYDAAVIGQSGDIYTALDDCRIISDGYAYYGAEGEYIVKELPVVEHNTKDGYIYSFDGWYTHEGYKLCIGDAIDIRTTIYPRWDISRISYNVNYIDILGDQPDGQVLGTNTSTVYCNDEVSGSDIGSDESASAYYNGLYYTGCTSVTVQEDCNVYRYFRPALYNITFNGNMSTSGETTSLSNCTYGEKYNLTENGFKRSGTVTLDLNAEDAVCTTKNINITYEFKGWSETSDGNAIYEDCASVSNLCSADGEKQLYAIWTGGAIEINAIPERDGYRFDGWSKDQTATSGNTWFDVSDSNDCILYAVWIKKQEDTDNSGNDNNENIDNSNGEDKDYGNNGSTDSDGNTGNNGNTDNSETGAIDENTGNDNENSGNDINTDTSTDNGSEDNGNVENGTNSGNDENGEGADNSSDNTISSGTTDNGDKDNENGDSSSIDKDNKDKGDSSSTESSNSNNGSSSGTSSGSSGNSSNSGTNNVNSGTTGTTGTTGNSGNTVGSGINSGNQKPSTGSQGVGSQNTGTTSGNNTTNITESINNSDTNIDNDKDNEPIIDDDNVITQTPDINIDNKKENKKDEVSKSTPAYPKVGKKYKKSGIIYKIIKSNRKKRTVKVIKAVRTITEVKVPGSIKIKGYRYKVVSIRKKAFIKCSKLKKAVIGKNIKSIGKKAFYKNKELGNIKIKSKKLKSIGKSAFKRIKPNCAVKIAGSKKYAQRVFEMMNA